MATNSNAQAASSASSRALRSTVHNIGDASMDLTNRAAQSAVPLARTRHICATERQEACVTALRSRSAERVSDILVNHLYLSCQVKFVQSEL
jgi:hypothetical protein